MGRWAADRLWGTIMESDLVAGARWATALEYLQLAIRLLDESNAPAHIAAHVDLAVHQLQEAIDACPRNYPARQMDTNAEPQ